MAFIVAWKQSSPNPDEKEKYSVGRFLITIHVIINKLDSSSLSHYSQDYSESSQFGSSAAPSHFTCPTRRSFAYYTNALDFDIDFYDELDLELNALEQNLDSINPASMYEYAVYGLHLHGADPESLRNSKHSVHAIKTDFLHGHQDSFDTTQPCVICGEHGHDFNR